MDDRRLPEPPVPPADELDLALILCNLNRCIALAQSTLTTLEKTHDRD